MALPVRHAFGSPIRRRGDVSIGVPFPIGPTQPNRAENVTCKPWLRLTFATKTRECKPIERDDSNLGMTFQARQSTALRTDPGLSTRINL